MSEEKPAAETTTPAAAAPATTTNDTTPDAPPPPVPTAEACCPTTDAAETTVAGGNTTITSNWGNTMRRHFQNTNKYMRDKWTNVANMTTTTAAAWPKISPPAHWDVSPLIFIAIVTFVAIGCSAVALSTPWWSCDTWTGSHYGLWNTCFGWSNDQRQVMIAEASGADSGRLKKNVHKHVLPELTGNETSSMLWSLSNSTTTTTTSAPPEVIAIMKCADQVLGHVEIVQAEKSRVDHVTYAQGLLISGASLYFLSWFAIIWAWWWMRGSTAAAQGTITWLNSVRNILTFAVLAQVFSFLLQLVGFFLFIYTDRFSTSIVLLFFYFGIAIVSTNLTNFITIEYKIFKQRHQAC